MSKNDLINSILGSKPQPEKAEASSLEQDEKLEEKNHETVEQDDDTPPPLRYRRVKKVPYLKKWPKCGMCSTVLLGDRFGWFAEDEDGGHWWWCVPCMEKCDCYATEEEIKRAQKERKSRAK